MTSSSSPNQTTAQFVIADGNVTSSAVKADPAPESTLSTHTPEARKKVVRVTENANASQGDERMVEASAKKADPRLKKKRGDEEEETLALEEGKSVADPDEVVGDEESVAVAAGAETSGEAMTTQSSDSSSVIASTKTEQAAGAADKGFHSTEVAPVLPWMLGVGAAGLAIGGGGGGEKKSAPQTMDVVTEINGSVVAGKAVAGLVVRIVDDNGTLLATTTTDNNGMYLAQIKNLPMGTVVRVIVTDPAIDQNGYIDEYTGDNVDLSTILSAWSTVVSTHQTINVTPVTEIAARMIASGGVFSPEEVAAANIAVASLLGLRDENGNVCSPESVPAVSVGDQGFASAPYVSQAYGHILAALSSADHLAGGTDNALTLLTDGVKASWAGPRGQEALELLNKAYANALTAGSDSLITSCAALVAGSDSVIGAGDSAINIDIKLPPSGLAAGDTILFKVGGTVIGQPYELTQADIDAGRVAGISVSTDDLTAGPQAISVHIHNGAGKDLLLGAPILVAVDRDAVTVGHVTDIILLTNEQIGDLTVANIRCLAPADLAMIHADQVAALSTAQLDYFTAEQLASFGAGAIPGFTSEQISSLSAEQLALFKGPQIDALSADQIAHLNADQLAALAKPAAPTLTLASDTGALNTDGITSNGTIMVSGLLQGTHWEYTTDGGQHWQVGAGTSFVLPSDIYSANSVQVRQIDGLARVGAADGNATTFIIDTVAPTAPTAALAIDSGISTHDDVSNIGIVNVMDLEAGASWQYKVNDGSWQNGTGTTFILTEGLYQAGSVVVRQIDVAGNPGMEQANASAITIDKTSSALTTTLVFSIDTYDNNTPAAEIASVANDYVTSVGAQDLSGQLSSALGQGEIVMVSLDNGTSWSAANSVVGSASWTLNGVTLVGANTIKVRVDDAAGNIGHESEFNYVIDNEAYSGTAHITGYDDDFGINKGTYGNGTTTDDRNVTLKGDLSVVLQADEKVAVYGGELGGGSNFLGYATHSDTAWTFDHAVGHDGTFVYTTQVIDAAGNVTFSSPTFTMIVDTAGPDASVRAIELVDGVLGHVGVSLIGETPALTNDSTPMLLIHLDKPAATGEVVAVYQGAAHIGNATYDVLTGYYAFDMTSAPLAGGTSNFSVQIEDAEGRTSAARNFDIVLDIEPPTIALAGGSTNIDVQSGIVYNFSEANMMLHGTGVVRLQASNGRDVTFDVVNGVVQDTFMVGGISYTGGASMLSMGSNGSGQSTLRIDLTNADWDFGTTYTLSINDGVFTDAAGNPLSGVAGQQAFTTVTPSDSGTMAQAYNMHTGVLADSATYINAHQGNFDSEMIVTMDAAGGRNVYVLRGANYMDSDGYIEPMAGSSTSFGGGYLVIQNFSGDDQIYIDNIIDPSNKTPLDFSEYATEPLPDKNGFSFTNADPATYMDNGYLKLVIEEAQPQDVNLGFVEDFISNYPNAWVLG